MKDNAGKHYTTILQTGITKKQEYIFNKEVI